MCSKAATPRTTGSKSGVREITVCEPLIAGFSDSEKLKEEYEKLVRERKKENAEKATEATGEDTVSTTTVVTTASTVPSADSSDPESTTVTTVTTVSSQTVPTTAHLPDEEENDADNVSNGKKPFNYNDVSSIADDVSTLGGYVSATDPSVIKWNAESFQESGYVKITLESPHGIVVLDVKPLDNVSLGKETGSVSGDGIAGWEWLTDNDSAGCNISSVVWKDGEFGISPVRNIGVGSTLACLTDNYLCVNGGANTLYKASDVISDQNKLNSILAAENLYTFVGGRVYSIGSYLDKYYSGKEHSFRFEDCDYVVQYGCNSIMEHNYSTGSWIIEYAVKEDTVIGITFMNKSYYNNESKTAVSTNAPSSGTEFPANTTNTTYSETGSLTGYTGVSQNETETGDPEDNSSATTENEEAVMAE